MYVCNTCLYVLCLTVQRHKAGDLLLKIMRTAIFIPAALQRSRGWASTTERPAPYTFMFQLLLKIWMQKGFMQWRSQSSGDGGEISH